MRYLIFFLFLTISIISCSDEDPLSETIIGTWDLHSVQFTNCQDPDENIEETFPDENGCFLLHSDTFCNVFLVFSSDGTVVENVTVDGGTDTNDYSYTVNDENNTVLFCEDANDCSTITVDGDIATLTIIDSDCTIKVKYEKS